MSKARWIDQGYEVFAFQGFEALKVERLAVLTGVSKPSFYHYFADLEIFCACLFDKRRLRFIDFQEINVLCNLCENLCGKTTITAGKSPPLLIFKSILKNALFMKPHQAKPSL